LIASGTAAVRRQANAIEAGGRWLTSWSQANQHASSTLAAEVRTVALTTA
jgi:hypothetical protein